MPEASIGGPRERVIFTAHVENDPPARLEVTLHADGLVATTGVDGGGGPDGGFEDLARFFRGLEQDWRGWEGARGWESVEGDLRLVARHEFAHVRLTVTLRLQRFEWGNDGWSASADITLDPGEQLSRAAREIGALVAGAA
jgi:hypothetical protein